MMIHCHEECINNYTEGNEELHEWIKDYCSKNLLGLFPAPAAVPDTEDVYTFETACNQSVFQRFLLGLGCQILIRVEHVVSHFHHDRGWKYWGFPAPGPGSLDHDTASPLRVDWRRDHWLYHWSCCNWRDWWRGCRDQEMIGWCPPVYAILVKGIKFNWFRCWRLFDHH